MTTARRNHRASKKNSSQFAGDFSTFLVMQQFARREIGARIAFARRERGGMTQEQLAELLNVTTRTVQNWEAGESIPWRYFQRMEEVFPGKSLGWFLNGDEADEGSTERAADEAVAERLDHFDEQLARVEAGQQEIAALVQAVLDVLGQRPEHQQAQS